MTKTNANEERLLPNGWYTVAMDKVADVQSGAGFPKKYQGNTNGELPFAKVSDISESVENGKAVLKMAANYVSKETAKNLRAKVFPVDSTVFAKIGEAVRLNRRAIVGKPCCVDNNVMGLWPNKSTVVPRYLFYFMHTVDLYDLSRATTVPSVRKSDVAEIQVPLAPLPEQERIVAEIEKQFTRLDTAVATLHRLQANLDRYKASVLKAACEGRLVPQDPNDEPADQLLQRILTERRRQWQAANPGKKYKEPMELNDVENPPSLPEIPSNWVWAPLGQLTWNVKDGPHYSPKYAIEGIPFISGGNVRPDGVDFENTKFITPELHEELSKRCKPELGDILYTKGGTTGIARVNTYEREFNVWVHVAVLKLVPLIEPFYIQHALNSPFCYLQSQKYTHGVGNQDLGLTRMVKIVLALPPLAEQERIVAEVERRLSVVAATQQAITANLARAGRLRQSILQQAFTGQLVPQLEQS